MHGGRALSTFRSMGFTPKPPAYAAVCPQSVRKNGSPARGTVSADACTLYRSASPPLPNTPPLGSWAVSRWHTRLRACPLAPPLGGRSLGSASSSELPPSSPLLLLTCHRCRAYPVQGTQSRYACGQRSTAISRNRQAEALMNGHTSPPGRQPNSEALPSHPHLLS